MAVTHSFLPTFNSRYKSRSCFGSTPPGESVMRQVPLAVLGNAITSRMLGVPQRIAISRSKPSAMPPCGGCAVAECLQHVTEACLHHLGGFATLPQRPSSARPPVNSNGAAPNSTPLTTTS